MEKSPTSIMPNDGMEIRNIDKRLYSKFYPLRPLSLLRDKPDPGCIYNFLQSFEKVSRLSENIIFCLTSFPEFSIFF